MRKFAYNKVKKIMPPKSLNKTMWGVVAPDGYIQSRSIADTKKMSKDQVCHDGETWEGYKAAGFRIYKIKVKITFP